MAERLTLQRAEDLAQYLLNFRRINDQKFRQAHLASTSRDYGQYVGKSRTKNAVQSLTHYTNEYFTDPAIPGRVYTSPEHFVEMIENAQTFISDVLKDLVAARDEAIKNMKLVPEPIQDALEIAHKTEHAIKYVLNQVQQYRSTEVASAAVSEDILSRLDSLALGLPRALHILENPARKNMAAFKVKDEYDLGQVFHALMSVFWPDVQPEAPTPAVAGSSSRVDFHIRRENTVVELKYPRGATGADSVKDALSRDFVDYPEMKNCRQLFILIYDPEGIIKNQAGFEADMSKPRPPIEAVQCRIIPQR